MYSEREGQSGDFVAANDLKRGRGYGMSLNGNVASDGYNRMDNNAIARKPEWRLRSRIVSIVTG